MWTTDLCRRLIQSVRGFKGSSSTKRMTDIVLAGEAVKRSALQAKEHHEKIIKQYNNVTDMVHAAGGMLWRKDLDLRYEFGNAMLCRRFLLPDRCAVTMTHEECTEAIRGRTTNGLIEDFICRTKLPHSFAGVTEVTDNHTLGAGQQCQFYEFGVIGDQAVALYVTKTPMYSPENGRLIGLVGFGFDESHRCVELLSWVKEKERLGQAIVVAPGVYTLSEKQNACTPAEMLAG